MRAIVLAAFLAGTVAAETPNASLPERVTITRAELAAMQAELETVVRQRESAAFERGQMDARQRCASLI